VADGRPGAAIVKLASRTRRTNPDEEDSDGKHPQAVAKRFRRAGGLNDLAMVSRDEVWVSPEDASGFVRLLQHANGHGVVFVDPEGFITGWSQGALHVTGFQAKDVIGRPFGSLFVPEDRERGLPQQEMNAAIAMGCSQDERWHVRKDGSRFWSSGLTYARHDDQGAVTGFIKIFRDATHLRTRMRYLENVLEHRDAQHAGGTPSSARLHMSCATPSRPSETC
jgi:PAS domain S-box-containing protein